MNITCLNSRVETGDPHSTFVKTLSKYTERLERSLSPAVIQSIRARMKASIAVQHAAGVPPAEPSMDGMANSEHCGTV